MLLGFSLGFTVGAGIYVWTLHAYRKMLVKLAETNGSECINGKWIKLSLEEEFNID